MTVQTGGEGILAETGGSGIGMTAGIEEGSEKGLRKEKNLNIKETAEKDPGEKTNTRRPRSPGDIQAVILWTQILTPSVLMILLYLLLSWS